MAVSTLPEAPNVQLVNCLKVEAVPTAHRNTVLRTVEFADQRDGRKFRLGYSGLRKSGNYSPRHRHTFDQIRFIPAGRVKYGALRLEEGDCVYFPEGVFYGPTEPLSDESANCTIQTQGPSWGGFLTNAEMEHAGAMLAGQGHMDRATGQFIWNDGRSQDSFEAMLSKMQGRPVEYPEARYHLSLIHI